MGDPSNVETTVHSGELPTVQRMAKLETLVAAVSDPDLRGRIQAEVAVLKERSRFGLVYERHLPETVIVGDIEPLEVGDHGRPKVKLDGDEDFRVVSLNSRKARIRSLKTDEESDVALKELLVVKRFGDPAYAGLESLGTVSRSKERPYHAVVNGENYHALQALALMCECVGHDPFAEAWSGEWPGAAECRALGWWAVCVPEKGWRPCPPGTPGAREDINRLTFYRQTGYDCLYDELDGGRRG